MSQHASLSPERWAKFSLDQQILMIGNEMNRASRWKSEEDLPSLQLSYERILRLVDLTVEVQRRPTLHRELLRWRDLIAALYIGSHPNPQEHAAAFRSLLLLTPAAAQQIPYVLAGALRADAEVLPQARLRPGGGAARLLRRRRQPRLLPQGVGLVTRSALNSAPAPVRRRR